MSNSTRASISSHNPNPYPNPSQNPNPNPNYKSKPNPNPNPNPNTNPNPNPNKKPHNMGSNCSGAKQLLACSRFTCFLVTSDSECANRPRYMPHACKCS